MLALGQPAVWTVQKSRGAHPAQPSKWAVWHRVSALRVLEGYGLEVHAPDHEGDL